MLKLIYYNDDNKPIVFKDEIADEELKIFLNAKQFLIKTMDSIDYYNIVKDNIIDLMNAVINFKSKNKKSFATINRHLFNMVNSFYAFVKYYERHHDKKYARIFSEQFDKYDSYKIISELRRYSTHCYLPITKATIELITGKISIQIDPKELIEKDSKNMNKLSLTALNKYIENNKVIDLGILTTDFLSVFSELQVKIMNEMKLEVSRNIDLVEKYVYREESILKETFFITEDGNIINTSSIISLIIDKFEQEYVSSDDSLFAVMNEINKTTLYTI